MSSPGEETKKEDSTVAGTDVPEEEAIEATITEASDDGPAEEEMPGADPAEEEMPGADPAEEETPVSGEITIEEQLEKALAEIATYKDVALRAEAEMQNVRRRTERDIENAHKFGLERFLQNLLPVLDSIEKAIDSSEQAGPEEDDSVMEGVRLCYKLLLEALDRENVEVVDPLGEPFDPNVHEAMSVVENPDMEPNSVFAVVQKGYKLNSRLVRPAMVLVSKAPAD
ncbi:MAG: nucleotide exchange factor GrpE [Gammaproteobacteria bacterium]|nr:nucleotide exchange factor GrpE [Gammaproteobacteria bacterium]